MTRIAPQTMTRMKKKEVAAGYLFLLPVMVLMGLFVFYGLFYVLRLSFFKWDGLTPGAMTFRGLKNYASLFSNAVFLKSLANVFIFMVFTVTIQMFLGLCIALMLRPKLFGHRIFKALFYIPVALSTTVITRTFMGLYEPNFGLINATLRYLELEGLTRAWLGDQNTALWCIVFTNIFQWTGAQMVYYIAGLTAISDEIFEAAQIDGAGFWSTFAHVVFPSLWSTHTTVIILGMVGAIKTFDIVWLFTQGGPGNATQFPATLLYQAVAQNSKAGYGAAISVVMIALCVILSAMQLKFNKWRQEA